MDVSKLGPQLPAGKSADGGRRPSARTWSAEAAAEARRLDAEHRARLAETARVTEAARHAAAERRAAAAAAWATAAENAIYWKVTYPLRRFAGSWPPGPRRLLRGGAARPASAAADR